MKMLRKILIVGLIIYTAASLSLIVYANTVPPVETPGPPPNGKIYSADKLDQEPDEWYLPEDIGIVVDDIIDYGSWLHVPVKDEPFPFDVERPCFKYNDNYYKISRYNYTPARPGEEIRRIQFPLGLGILASIPGGFFLYKGRKSDEKSINR